MRTLKSYKQINRICGGRQINAQSVLNGRIKTVSKGWESVKLSEDFKELLTNDIANSLGGRYKTKQSICRNLKSDLTPQHWGLSRLMLEGGKSEFYWSYCAGQDYPYELQQIRNSLRN